jgi:hypothetical protein
MADEGSTEGLTGTRGERSPWTLREDRYHSDPLAGRRILWLVPGGTIVAAALFAVKSIRALRAGRWALGVLMLGGGAPGCVPACLATSLNNLRSGRVTLGRQEETLAAIHEASTISW